MENYQIILIAFAIVVGAIIIYAEPALKFVPQEKRLVIYRAGHFHDIVGPGPRRGPAHREALGAPRPGQQQQPADLVQPSHGALSADAQGNGTRLTGR